VDVRYINPFIEAVQHVFKTMLETDTLISKPAIKSKDATPADVSAIIGFAGGASGSVSLCFSRQVATKVASKLPARRSPSTTPRCSPMRWAS
jgi:chemotaxis protein CheX